MGDRRPIARLANLRRSTRQPTPLPDTDFPDAARSNISPNLVSENGITGFVECLVRHTNRGRDNDFLLDLSGATEDLRDRVTHVHRESVLASMFRVPDVLA